MINALTTAHALFRNRDAWLAPAERLAILRKAAGLMQERAEFLALDAAREGGKPLIGQPPYCVSGRLDAVCRFA
jgi:acyl-CoA reductase-like NAD-dependent aldehyde dehydrogenase